jgi:hypothetical protein
VLKAVFAIVWCTALSRVSATDDWKRRGNGSDTCFEGTAAPRDWDIVSRMKGLDLGAMDEGAGR